MTIHSGGEVPLGFRRQDVSAFIDWQSQLINSGGIGLAIKRRAAERSLSFITERIKEFLEPLDPRAYFSVEVKIYHGWHRGLTPTENYMALRDIFSDSLAPTRLGRASFDWRAPFGNILSNAFDHRLHPVLRVHLPNTLRADLDEPDEIREKMTDTALACDVLSSARSSPTEIRLILGEDDDLVPPAFVAEKWGKQHGGKTYILRRREDFNFLRLDGICRYMRPFDVDA